VRGACPWRMAFDWLRAGWSDLVGINPLPQVALRLRDHLHIQHLSVWALFSLYTNGYVSTGPALAGIHGHTSVDPNGPGYEKSRRLRRLMRTNRYRRRGMEGLRQTRSRLSWPCFRRLLLCPSFTSGCARRSENLGIVLWHRAISRNGIISCRCCSMTPTAAGAVLSCSAVRCRLFAAFSFAISVFAGTVMLRAERTDAMSALGTSMRMVWSNLPVMLAWGAIVPVLFLLSVTDSLGLIRFFHFLGQPTWHA